MQNKMDFTLNTYKLLLSALLASGYSFQTYFKFVQDTKEKAIIMRHDVDRLSANALQMARLEYEMGIGSTYYFRVVSQSWDESIIREIADLGHEIGYHYEDLSMCKGDMERAIMNFKSNLARMRKLVPVSTICMHGSPLSKYDNKKIWEKYDYRDYGIIAEPYFDLDFAEVFYLTDTGRYWNNAFSSVRDRVKSSFDIAIQSTSHLIALAEQNALPHQIMINVHPQRWTDNPVEWVKELVWQNVKNVVKRLMLKFRPQWNALRCH